MKFNKYNSIENSYRENEIQKIINNGLADNCKWVVTEKIHGCNFSFLSDGETVKVAKRSSIISGKELSNFYCSNIMLDKYEENIKNLAKYIIKNYDASFVQIYGEHFGGIYNNKVEKGHKLVQKEVQYIPFTDFIVYDILITFYSQGEIVKQTFMNWDLVKSISDKFKIKTVPELFRGTFEECLNYPNKFQTTIPNLYELEPIENNICEGVVIKPLNDLRFPNGERVILKNKNDKFKEKGKRKKVIKNIELNKEQEKIVEEITKYFEISRIESVLSKGEVKLDWKQFNKLSGLFFKDAIEDFNKDYPDFKKLDKKEQKIIQKFAQQESQNFIREFMKKRI